MHFYQEKEVILLLATVVNQCPSILTTQSVKDHQRRIPEMTVPAKDGGDIWPVLPGETQCQTQQPEQDLLFPRARGVAKLDNFSSFPFFHGEQSNEH